MDKINELYERYKNIRNPFNYFKGIGNISMPIPNNVLCFIRVNYGMTGFSESMLSHYRYVCIFNFREPLEIIIDGKLQIVGSEEGIFLLPYQYHKFPFPEKEKNIFAIFITFEMEDNSYFENFRFYNFEIEENIKDYLLDFNSAYIQKNKGKIPLYLSLLLLHIHNKSILLKNEINVENMNNYLLQKIITIIHSDLKINILEIADKLGYSENYIRRYFKRKMGFTLGSYIVELKISKSLFYLYKTDYLITEIAELCGYDSLYSFSRSFKQVMKYSPNEFRKNIKRQPELLKDYLGYQENTKSKKN